MSHFFVWLKNGRLRIKSNYLCFFFFFFLFLLGTLKGLMVNVCILFTLIHVNKNRIFKLHCVYLVTSLQPSHLFVCLTACNFD